MTPHPEEELLAYEMLIAAARFFYYHKDDPVMSDACYDIIERRYRKARGDEIFDGNPKIPPVFPGYDPLGHPGGHHEVTELLTAIEDDLA